MLFTHSVSNPLHPSELCKKLKFLVNTFFVECTDYGVAVTGHQTVQGRGNSLLHSDSQKGCAMAQHPSGVRILHSFHSESFILLVLT
jgi:hypothetical protein